MTKRSNTLPTLIIVIVLFLAFLLSASVGSYTLNANQLLDPDSHDYLVFWQIRLPRTLLTLIVGACLGICGAAMQGLFRNPLADPSLIGISSGAALGAGIAIVFTHELTQRLLVPSWLILGLTPLFAFSLGLMVTLILYRLATQYGKTHIAILLLAGVAIQAITGAALGLLTYIADNNELRDLTFWSMGSFNAANWVMVALSASVILPSLVIILRQYHALNALMLGEQNAFYLGFNVERKKRIIIVLTALMIGVAVSVSGIIGFIGLVVPHLIRLMFGANHRFLLLGSAIFGATLLLLADTISRTLIAPAELPIGIITALFGGPFFLYLLLKQRRHLPL